MNRREMYRKYNVYRSMYYLIEWKSTRIIMLSDETLAGVEDDFLRTRIDNFESAIVERIGRMIEDEKGR